MKSMLSKRRLGTNAKKCLYEEVIVPTTLYGAETWGMRSDEWNKVIFSGDEMFQKLSWSYTNGYGKE